MTDRGQQIANCTEVIKARAGVTPEYGLVLGSGLGPLADQVTDAVVIDYADLPGFPEPGVAGHAGRLIIGNLGGMPVAVMQGRAHYYEHGDASVMAVAVRTLKAIGCHTLILTNAAGSLDAELGPGSAMILRDHINLTGVSPLFNETGNDRFVNLGDAYDADLRADLRLAASAAGVDIGEGVYCWYCGPHFETPAEIQMAKVIGGTAVGMSTAPEVILARHAGMKVAAMSNMTNMAAGLSDEVLSHEHTQTMAAQGAKKISAVLQAFFAARAPR